MAYKNIDNDYADSNYTDGQSLPSALAHRLVHNGQWLLNNRLKKYAINYDGSGITTKFTDVQAGITSGNKGYVTPIGKSTIAEPNAIGLQFSTGPAEPLCLPPIMWPLSARAGQIRFTLAMAALNASVEVFVFGRLGSRIFGSTLEGSGYLDDDGIWQFNDDVKTSDQYVEVTTSLPTNKLYSPVQVTLDVGRAPVSDIDWGKHGSEDPGTPLELYICFHSKQGSLDKTVKADGTNVPLGGFEGATVQCREIDLTYQDLQTAGFNPCTYHRWLDISNVIDGISSDREDNTGIAPLRHVLQARPADFSDTSVGGAVFVIHPPLAALAGFTQEASLALYECGVARLGSITIEELD